MGAATASHREVMLAATRDNVLAAVELFLQRVRVPTLYESEGLEALLARLTARAGTSSELPPKHALRLADALANRVPGVPSTCLYRALARYAVLRRRGCRARFVMGVVGSDPERAHAWVELDGKPVYEDLMPGLVPTFGYPPLAAQ
jgi:hypothetical protein